jgi:glycosyltransferase involved in cell wall biosynthesis
MLEVVHLLSGDLWAGAESASAHLIAALAQRGDLRVRALLLNEGELSTRLRRAGVPVEIEPEAGARFASLARRIRARLRGCDLVHAHRYKEDLIAALSGRPWLATQHGRPEPFRGAAAQKMRAYLALDLAAKRWSARRVIAVSREVEEWLARRVGTARTALLPNGIADPQQNLAPRRYEERPARVGVLARLAPVKGIELAIDAVARVPELELEIVGDGPERAALEARAQASGAAARIHFAGFDPEPLPRLAQWRALLVTSHHEGHPISALEALALGTPILAGPLRGLADAMDGQGGECLPDRDPETWARALRRLALNPGELGRVQSRAARERFLANYEVSGTAARVAELYRALAAASPARTHGPQPAAATAVPGPQTRSSTGR